jgi:DMSO reductase anchor subunit
MQLFTLLFDAGLLVLIWLVQCIIYPSFLHYRTENLRKWHRSYTRRLSYIVIPLMLGQLGTLVFITFTNPNTLNIIKLSLLLLVWLLTFSIFVPLHNAMENSNNTSTIAKNLVQKNWYRTILWSLIFGIGLWSFLFIP